MTASGSSTPAQAKSPGSSDCCWSNITPMANARMYPCIVLIPALGADTEVVENGWFKKEVQARASDIPIGTITTLYQNPFAILPIEAAAQATRG